MSTVADVAIAASLILDIIDAYNKNGVDVTIADLEKLVAEREAEKEKLNEALGLDEI